LEKDLFLQILESEMMQAAVIDNIKSVRLSRYYGTIPLLLLMIVNTVQSWITTVGPTMSRVRQIPTIMKTTSVLRSSLSTLSPTNNLSHKRKYIQQHMVLLSSSLSSVDSDDDTNIANGQFSSTKQQQFNYEPMFDFSNNISYAIDKIERLDDAIMGGISTSSVRPYVDIIDTDNNNKSISYARWSGVCRTDGG
jgi:hypothetical protein